MALSQRSQLISLYEALIKCWNTRDAKGMAGLYANGGGQIGFDGSQISGPGDIEKHLAPIFRDHPTARFVFIIREVKLLGEAVGLVRAIAGMVSARRHGDQSIPERGANNAGAKTKKLVESGAVPEYAGAA